MGTDSFPPGEREWLLKVLRDSERRSGDKMLKLYDICSGLDSRLEGVELALYKTGKKAGVNATLNSGAIVSLLVAVVVGFAEKMGWL